MKRTRTAGLILIVIALTGCASLGSTAAAGSGASAPPSSASSQMCTTKACIGQEVQQSLVGTIAKDESIMTKVKCKKSSVKHNAGDTWTATCTVTYSDGTVAKGYGTLLPAQDKVAFEPVSLAGQ